MFLYYNVLLCVKKYVLKQNIRMNIKMIDIMFYRYSFHLPNFCLLYNLIIGNQL